MQLSNSIKKKIPNGLRNSLSRLPFEIRAVIKHHKALIKAKRYSGSLLRLNVGCGENKKDGYINVDICNKECLQLDMREKLPFSDKSVSIIYSEHFLEHLPEQYALQFLNESFRVLIPGGLFSAGVPDGQVLLESYANGLNVENFKIHELSDILPGKPTRMQIVNLMFRRFGHHYTYDYETLEKILASIGFSNIHRRPFDPDIDSEYRRDWTLYVNAYKTK